MDPFYPVGEAWVCFREQTEVNLDVHQVVTNLIGHAHTIGEHTEDNGKNGVGLLTNVHSGQTLAASMTQSPSYGMYEERERRGKRGKGAYACS